MANTSAIMHDAKKHSNRASSVFESTHYLSRQHAKRLASRRDRCVEQSQYREAGKLHRELETVVADHEVMEGERARLKQLQDNLRLIHAQAQELREFNEKWNIQLKDFKRKVEFLKKDFAKDQRTDHRSHLQEIRSSVPQLKTSKKLVFMRGQAASLAKLEKFDEAAFVKEDADKHEKGEIKRHAIKVDNISRQGGKETFIKAQATSRGLFEDKIELDWMKLNVARRKETDDLLKRQNNERKRFLSRTARSEPEITSLLSKTA